MLPHQGLRSARLTAGRPASTLGGMADFCNQCAHDHDFEAGDLSGLCKPDEAVQALCEGCGPNYVDSAGNCLGSCLKSAHQDEVAKDSLKQQIKGYTDLLGNPLDIEIPEE